MVIDCPFCGTRELREFHFSRVLKSGSHDAFTEVYERDNSLEHSIEYWQHRHGCHAWLIVERNPSTAQVLSVRQLRVDTP